MDLDLNNYDLPDLLALFKLDYDFNEDDLRRAKKIILQTHPDKSPELGKEYFLFFSEAYKMIYSIYQFRNKSKFTGTKYCIDEQEDNNKELLFKNFCNKPNFNERFNELFDKYKIKDIDVDSGYGEWLKSNEDIDTRTTTFSEMNESFQKKKKEIQALVKVDDYESLCSGGYNLVRDKPECYSSSLFSQLGYEDLKKAHIESVIPVTQEDYLKKTKYKNVNELLNSSDYQNINPLSVEQSRSYLDEKKYGESKNDVRRAFTLAKQDEEARKIEKNIMSSFMRLDLINCAN